MQRSEIVTSVEFIYDKHCPNIKATRQHLLKAFVQLGLKAQWTEWERGSKDSPSYASSFGSPTILVQGKDLTGLDESSTFNSCRLYETEDGHFQGVPPFSLIVNKLQQLLAHDDGEKKIGRWRRLLTLLPVIGVAFMPKLICPACWPAYAGILSALGISFVNYSPYLMPLTFIFVFFVLISLLYKASKRRGYNPFLLGLLSSAFLLISKFVFASNEMMYVALGLLIGACVWNAWPMKNFPDQICPDCTSRPNKKGGDSNESQKKD